MATTKKTKQTTINMDEALVLKAKLTELKAKLVGAENAVILTRPISNFYIVFRDNTSTQVYPENTVLFDQLIAVIESYCVDMSKIAKSVSEELTNLK